MTKFSPREGLFGNVVEIKVVGDDKNSCFQFFLDVLDHLGEVQAPRTDQGESQGMTFWQCC